MPHLPRISIITTVYDARDYLPLTVDSILAQTFTDFELLLVEDGSPNGCGALCDALAQKDARIRVFHKPNGGPASAANRGLDEARGAYVGFVDSDDLIDPAMFETLYRAIQQSGTRLAACAGDAIDEAGVLIPGQQVCSACCIGQKMDAMALFLDAFQTGSFYGPLSWNKLFDIRLFRDKGIHYDESMFYGDDASVLHRVFEGEEIVCLPTPLYHYRMRPGQMTGAVFAPRKLDDLRMYWDWLCYFSARPNSRTLYEWAVVRYWQLFYLFWCLAGAAGNQKELTPAFMAHKKHLNAILPELLHSPHLPVAEKLRAVLFSISPALTYRLASAKGTILQAERG
ncbi:MAG: glycosyltransferase family 2 protein [Gemmiger sp.]|nr:glycosyltransferase family 2 protein [Gemmiger sp.]